MNPVSAHTREQVCGRARMCCERDGASVTSRGGQIHHRQPRQMGGSRLPEKHEPQNLVLLCVACHAWIERKRERAYADGWLVRTGFDPAAVPVPHALYGHVWLTADGGWTDRPPTPESPHETEHQP